MAATRMVLRLTCEGKSKYVAVPLDKDLGSPETSAEIARAFGVSAGRLESISFVTYVNQEVQERAEWGSMITKSKQVAHYEEIPLNLNGHDLAHPYNACIKGVLLNADDRRWKIEVKFAIERSFREHE